MGARDRIQLSAKPLSLRRSYFTDPAMLLLCIFVANPPASPNMLMHLRLPGYCRHLPRRFVSSPSTAWAARPGSPLPASLLSDRFHLDAKSLQRVAHGSNGPDVDEDAGDDIEHLAEASGPGIALRRRRANLGPASLPSSRLLDSFRPRPTPMHAMEPL